MEDGRVGRLQQVELDDGQGPGRGFGAGDADVDAFLEQARELLLGVWERGVEDLVEDGLIVFAFLMSLHHAGDVGCEVLLGG